MRRILYLADPATFSSLVLVSHDWHAASEIPHLYAYHLSRCPSFSIKNDVITGPFDEDSLSWLKRRFFQEIKRNLFDVFLRPHRTEINLISTNTSSAAAFPGGEAFEFAFSPNGHWTLALSSSRIYVIDTFSPIVSVQRELKVLRRPVSAAILDDGSVLAVLSSDHRVNIYSLADRRLKHCRALSLDNPPNTIALSPKGEVLAAAYNGGIEVHSLATSAPSTGRRDVKCDSVDSLTFSCDGTVLFGTTQNSKTPNTVILSAPYYSETNEELPSKDILSHMWTSQILFPNNTRDCSHAALLPHHSEGDSCWAFTYDRVFESFRAVRTDDLRNGTTYFTGPKKSGRSRPRGARRKLVPCTLPATSDRGELVAAGFFGKELWLYGVPESLDSTTLSQLDEPVTRNEPVRRSSRRSSTGSSNERSQSSPARSRTNSEATELKALPRWQLLVDRSRNVFAKGRRLMNIPGITGVHWVSRKIQSPKSYALAQRLVIVAAGGLSNRPVNLDEFAIVDGGRLIILDFDRTEENGKCEELTIEVGNVPPEVLEEEHVDMETEIALVRQRTVRQRRDAKIGTSVAEVLASASDHSLQQPPIPRLPPTVSAVAGETSATPGDSSSNGHIAQENPSAEGLSLEEASAVFDGPYSHTHPRSRSSLYRSATAVAANRQRNPPRIITPGRVEMRRADGRGELPHESDADNWVPPPPPYTPDPDRPLPEHLRLALMPRHTKPTQRAVEDLESVRRANTMTASEVSNSSSRRISSLPTRSMIPFMRTQSSNSNDRQVQEVVSDLRLQTPQLPRAMNPTRLSHGAAANEVSSFSTPNSPAASILRPLSAQANHHTNSSPTSLRGRLVALTSPVAEALTGGSSSHTKSASLPSSPINNRLVPPTLILPGTNLQRHLEHPLPVTPSPHVTGMSPPLSPAHQSHPSATGTTPAQEVERIMTGMPSAEQLANLHNRYRSPPPSTVSGPSRTGLSAIIGRANGAPPRAALGAAGTLSSPVAERRRSALAQRNSLAASSPSLLRPRPHRLETIESIGSTVSRSGTRSPSQNFNMERNLRRGRSRSLGPDTRIPRGEAKRGWFRRRKPKTPRLERIHVEREGDIPSDVWVKSTADGDDKAPKCRMM